VISRKNALIEPINNTDLCKADKAKAIAGVTRISVTKEAGWPEARNRDCLREIDAAFVWSYTQEGCEFWYSIYRAFEAAQ
jgi:hypothetical protein